MKPEQMTEALEQAAAQLGIQVRYDTMTGDAAGSGGLCKVKGTWWRDHRSQDAARRARRDADRGAGGLRHRRGLPAARSCATRSPPSAPSAARRRPATDAAALVAAAPRGRAPARRHEPRALIFSLSSGSSATALSSAARTFSRTAAGAPGPELLVDDPLDHPIDRRLGVDPAGGQLGRDVRGQLGRLRCRSAPAVAAAGSSARFVASAPASLSANRAPPTPAGLFALLIVSRSPDRRTATGAADLPCHAVWTLSRQARMFETAAFAVSCLARMTFDTVVNCWFSCWICCCSASSWRFDSWPCCIIASHVRHLGIARAAARRRRAPPATAPPPAAGRGRPASALGGADAGVVHCRRQHRPADDVRGDLGAAHQHRHAARQDGTKRRRGPLGLTGAAGVDLEPAVGARRESAQRAGRKSASGSGSGSTSGPPGPGIGRRRDFGFVPALRQRFAGVESRVGFFRGFLAPFRGGLYVLRHPLKRYLVSRSCSTWRSAIGDHVRRARATGARSWRRWSRARPSSANSSSAIMTGRRRRGAVPDRAAAAARGVRRSAVGARRARRARHGSDGPVPRRRRGGRCCTACSSSCSTASRWSSASASPRSAAASAA